MIESSLCLMRLLAGFYVGMGAGGGWNPCQLQPFYGVDPEKDNFSVSIPMHGRLSPLSLEPYDIKLLSRAFSWKGPTHSSKKSGFLGDLRLGWGGFLSQRTDTALGSIYVGMELRYMMQALKGSWQEDRRFSPLLQFAPGKIYAVSGQNDIFFDVAFSETSQKNSVAMRSLPSFRNRGWGCALFTFGWVASPSVMITAKIGASYAPMVFGRSLEALYSFSIKAKASSYLSVTLPHNSMMSNSAPPPKGNQSPIGSVTFPVGAGVLVIPKDSLLDSTLHALPTNRVSFPINQGNVAVFPANSLSNGINSSPTFPTVVPVKSLATEKNKTPPVSVVQVPFNLFRNDATSYPAPTSPTEESSYTTFLVEKDKDQNFIQVPKNSFTDTSGFKSPKADVTIPVLPLKFVTLPQQTLASQDGLSPIADTTFLIASNTLDGTYGAAGDRELSKSSSESLKTSLIGLTCVLGLDFPIYNQLSVTLEGMGSVFFKRGRFRESLGMRVNLKQFSGLVGIKYTLFPSMKR